MPRNLTPNSALRAPLDFIETERGLVKAAISLDGVTAELYLQGAQVTAWRPPDAGAQVQRRSSSVSAGM